MSLKSVISDDIEESKQNAKREQIVYSFLDKSVLYNELEFIPGIESYRNDVFKQKLDRKCKPVRPSALPPSRRLKVACFALSAAR